MEGTILQNAPILLLGVAAVIGVVAVALRGRSGRGSDRERQQWILARLAEQEATYPGGRFTDDEYLARVEALEERWDEMQRSRH
jgi:hypothetical protein